MSEVDGTYRLSPAGFEVLGAVLAGVYDEREDRDPVALDDPCPACGGTLTASYEDGILSVTCPDDHVFRNTLPTSTPAPRTHRRSSRPGVTGVA